MPATAVEELAKKISKGLVRNSDDIEREKILLSKKYNLVSVIRNAEIISYARNNGIYEGSLERLLKTKPVRTLSGVANIAVMWMPSGEKNVSCQGKCIYCPSGQIDENYIDAKGSIRFVPKSYTGVEPATMRAMRNNFEPQLQIKNRLKQLKAIGHATDKCELIIMGGTFLSAEKEFQENFVKKCFDALNINESNSLEEAQKKNESASNRCIGLTIETRADFCSEEHVKQMLRLSCTRVELGVQSTDDKILRKIKRGHDANANIKAIKLLKDAGLKVCVHWMPGLTGLYGNIDAKKEIEMFKELFANPDYRPDELKIYPVLVIPGTELHRLWQKGEYEPLTTEQAMRLLAEMKKVVPKYVRIKRVMRDISERIVAAGPGTTNLRQLVHEEMKKSGTRCSCIRCREVQNRKTEDIELARTDYEASGGKEIFLSFEDKNGILVAFLRLRIGNDTNTKTRNKMTHGVRLAVQASSNIAKIRELHVYGEMTGIGKSSEDKKQHHGYGRMLLQEAERIAKSTGMKKMQVTSGVGVREYYRKLGYGLEGNYMAKDLHA